MSVDGVRQERGDGDKPAAQRWSAQANVLSLSLVKYQRETRVGWRIGTRRLGREHARRRTRCSLDIDVAYCMATASSLDTEPQSTTAAMSVTSTRLLLVCKPPRASSPLLASSKSGQFILFLGGAQTIYLLTFLHFLAFCSLLLLLFYFGAST